VLDVLATEVDEPEVTARLVKELVATTEVDTEAVVVSEGWQ